jgi:hypothetical protein
MHEDERPIPLGRAAAATTAPAVEHAADPVAAVAPAPRPAPPVTEPGPRPPAHIERTTPRAVPPSDNRGPIPADAAATPAPAQAARVEPVVGPATARATHRGSGEHPMAGLRGFQMEVVDPFAGRGRDIARFVVAYLLVSSFVLALIVAFVALASGAGSGQA